MDDPEDILRRLGERSFLDLFVHMEAEALSRVLLNETATSEEKASACKRIDYYHKLSVCLTTGTNCPDRAALDNKKIVVIQETARLRQEWVEYLPFILFAYRTDTTTWRDASESPDLETAFTQLMQSAMQVYLEWHRAQIVFASVESLPDFAIEELARHGAPVEEVRKLPNQLVKSEINLQNVSRATIESVGIEKEVAELEANLQAMVSRARATERALDKYKNEIDARIDLLSDVLKDAQRNGLKSINGRLLSETEVAANELVNHAVEEGMQSLGSRMPAFIPLDPTGVLRLQLSNAQSINPDSAEIGFKGELVVVRAAPPGSEMTFTTEDGEVEPISVEETIPLGIEMERLKITARNPYAWQLPESQLRPFVRVNQPALMAALRRLGLPEVISFSSVSVTPDKTLENIDLHINITSPFTSSSSTLVLPLISNSTFMVDASAIQTLIRKTMMKVYQPEINAWMQRYSSSLGLPGTPFEMSAGDTKVEYLFDQHYLQATTVLTLLDTRDGSRASWKVNVIVNDQGEIKPVPNWPDAAAKKVIAYLENEIRAALPDNLDRFLSHVEFSVNNGRPAATVQWDLSSVGCRVDSILLDFSTDWLQKSEDIIRNTAAGLGNCAVEIALERTQEQLDQFLLNRELNLFGLLSATITQVETVGSKRRIDLAIESQESVPPFTIEGVMLDANSVGVAMSFRDAKVTEGRAELEQLGEALLKKYLPVPPESLSFRQTRLSPRGITTVVTLKDVPLLGTVEFGTLEISAYGVSFNDNRDKLRTLIRKLMTDKVNALLAESAVAIPEFGPITITGQPRVIFQDNQLQLWLKGTASLFSGLALQVEVPVFPKLDIDRIRIETSGVEETLKAALGDVGLNFGPLRINNVSAIERPLSLLFDAQVDFGFMKGKLTKATLHRNGLDLPETITTRTAGVVPLGQAVSIKDPGLTYYLRDQGRLTLLGDLIIGPGEATAELVYFDSRLTLSARPLSFAFAGDLVAANSLRLMEVKGEADFTDGVLTFEAKTNEILEKLIDVSATGKADFSAATIESVAHNRMLGIDMPSGSLFIDASEGTVRINGAADIPISKLDIGVQSDLLLREPSAATSFDFKVGSYRMANADIIINPTSADLRFNVLGFNFTVLAPSVGAITPDIVLRAILSVLDFDIESLLKSLENKDITISMFNKDGSRAQTASSGGDERNSKAGDDDSQNSNDDQSESGSAQMKVGGNNPSDHGTGGNNQVQLVCRRNGETFSIEERYPSHGFSQPIAVALPAEYFDQFCNGDDFRRETWSFVDAPSTRKGCDAHTGEPTYWGSRYYQRQLDCGLLTRGAAMQGEIKSEVITVPDRTWNTVQNALENGIHNEDAWRAAVSIYEEAREKIQTRLPDGVFMPLFAIDPARWHKVFEEESSGALLGLINPKVKVNVPTDAELGGWWRVATFFYHRQNRNIHMIGHCGTMPLGFASGSVFAGYRRGFSFYSPFGESPAHPLDYWDEVPDTLRECESSSDVLRPVTDLRELDAVTEFLNRSNILAPVQQDILWLELHARRKLDNPNAVGPEPRRLGSYSLPEDNGVPLNVEEVLYEPPGDPGELHLLVVNPDTGDGKSRRFYENTPVFDLLSANPGGEFNQFVAREIYRDFYLKSELEVNGRHLFGSYPAGYAGEPERLYCVGANRVSGPVTLVDAVKYGNWRTTHVPSAVSAFCEGQWETARLGNDTVQSLPVVLLADSGNPEDIDRLKLIVANPLSPDQPFVEVRELERVIERFAERSEISRDKIIDSLLHPNDYYPGKTRVHPFTLFISAQ